MPVIGRDNDHGVDVGPREEFAVIVDRRATAIGAGGTVRAVGFVGDAATFVAAAAVHIADGENLRVGRPSRTLRWPEPIKPRPIRPTLMRSLGGTAGSAPRAADGTSDKAVMPPAAAVAVREKIAPGSRGGIQPEAARFGLIARLPVPNCRLTPLKNSTHFAISGMDSSQL